MEADTDNHTHLSLCFVQSSIQEECETTECDPEMKSLSEMLSAGILLNTFLEFNFIGIFLLTKVKQGHCKKKNQVLQKYN